MPPPLADRRRPALAVAAALACVALFGLGVAIAPGASSDAAPADPAVSIRAVTAPAPLSAGAVRELGTLPALWAPRAARAGARGPARSGSSGAGAAVARPVAPPIAAPPVAPPVAPPPAAPPAVAPPPGPPSCIGAGCDYE